jgi:hypothetical protein
MLRSRSVPCLALQPCNMHQSWEFLNLRTGARVRKSDWKNNHNEEIEEEVPRPLRRSVQIAEGIALS